MADVDNRGNTDAAPALVRGGLEQRAYDAIEKDIKEFLMDIQNEKSLGRFHSEYKKLHRAFVKQHEFEKGLHKQCQDLSNKISENYKKMSKAMKLNEDKHATIQSLKFEIDKNWALVDDSQEREAECKERNKVLKIEISDLSDIVESGQAKTMAGDTQARDLEVVKIRTTKERDIQFGQLQDLRKDLDEWNDRVQSSEHERINMEHELGLLKDKFSTKKIECDR